MLNSSLGLDLFLRLTATDRMTGIVKEAENVKKKKPKKKRVQANDKHCVCVSAHEKEYAMIMKSADSISMETTV